MSTVDEELKLTDMRQNGNNKKGSIARNISYNTMLSVVSYLFTAIMVLYSSRVLQPDAYGRIGFARSVVGFFILFSNLGIPVYAMRTCSKCGDDRKELSEIFSVFFSLHVTLSIISSLFLVLSSYFIPVFYPARKIIIILGITILLNACGCDWFYKSQEEFRYLTIATFIVRLLAAIGMFLLVHSPEDINTFAVLLGLSTGGVGICNFFRLRKYVDAKFIIKPRIIKEHIKPILVFFLMSCATTVYGGLDLFMLGYMRSEYETGLYSLVSKAKPFLIFFGGVVWMAVLPRATKIWNEKNKKKFSMLAAKSVSAVSLVNFSLMAFCIIYAREIILFMGGDAYLDSVVSFRITALSIVPIGLSNILGGQVLIPTGKERMLLIAEVVGAIVNFLLNLIVIPRYSINGAAVTTLVAETTVWGICFYFCIKESIVSARKTLPSMVLFPAILISMMISYAVYYLLKSTVVESNWLLQAVGLLIVAIVYFGCLIIVSGLLRERTSRLVLRFARIKIASR